MAEQECNTCLPIETIIQSTVILEDIGEIAGGPCLMILTSEPNCGPNGDPSPVDATCLSKTYTSPDEALADWDASCKVYDALVAAFSQTPRVGQVKVGFYDPADVSSLDVLSKCAKCKAFVTPELRDDPAQVAIAAWAEANKCIYAADVCDPAHLNADPGTIGAQITAAKYEFTEIFYHSDCDIQKATAFMSWSLGHSFENGQDYTQFYSDVVGVPTVNIDTTQLENLTGFSSSTGLDSSAVQHVNVCACVDGCGDGNLFWGLTASGDFFDNRHYTCDVEDRIIAAQCNALRNGVPATIQGYAVLTNSVRNILRTDQLNGLIAGDLGNEDQDGLGYSVTIPTPADAGQALRSNRIAPCVQWTARRVNPVHIACNNGLITQ